MKFVSLAVLALCFCARQYADSPQTQAASAPDPQLHADAVKLVELSGAKTRMEQKLGEMIDSGKQQMAQQGPQCNAAFRDEWAKRMKARLKVDDFITVVVRAFEQHFTDKEINELIALQKAKAAGQPATPSAELKEKLESGMPTVQSEIMGGCVQVASKVGAEIGQEIGKEHPDYCQSSSGPNE